MKSAVLADITSKISFSLIKYFNLNLSDKYPTKIIKTRIVRESDYSPASQLFCKVKKTMTGNYHKLDLVNIDAHTKFSLIMSIRSQDIERKRKSDLNKGP